MSKRKSQLILVLTAALLVSILKMYNVPAMIHQASKSVNVEKISQEEIKKDAVLAVVSKVVDGDTIKVMIDDREETVRLIGINTPESVDPRVAVECFGHEASQKMRELVENRSVYLQADTTQSNRDKYDRLLRYVFLEDGTFINEDMVAQGYAFEYTYNLPYKYQKEFKSFEYTARTNELGLWNKSVCDYKENPKKGMSKKWRGK